VRPSVLANGAALPHAGIRVSLPGSDLNVHAKPEYLWPSQDTIRI